MAAEYNATLGKNLCDEITEAVSKMTLDDLWLVHKSVNEITYAANLRKYQQRGMAMADKPGPYSLVKAVDRG